MKTLVHRNLHNGLWALTQRGQVVGYCTYCELYDWDIKEDAKKALFSRSGNKRTVHLWARGTLGLVAGFVPFKGRELDLTGACDWFDGDTQPVTYNPKRGDQGFMRDGVVITGGTFAAFEDGMESA